VWYVHDNKIWHINPAVVTHIIERIEEWFGKMTVTRGKEHTFLGMPFAFNVDQTVSFSMKSYLEEAILDSKLNITKQAASAATKGLFNVDKSSTFLSNVEYETFHSIVAKLLYVSLRARPAIILSVSFLCTRVAATTIQDQKKLQRLLEYLHGTLDLILTLGTGR
jgi:hypothetical protein